MAPPSSALRGARLVSPVAAAIVLLLCAPAQAHGETPPVPPEVSAVSEYVETIPASGGAEAVGAAASLSTALSQEALDAIVTRGGREAGLLQMIATSTYYGAPSSPLRAHEDVKEAGGLPSTRLWIVLGIVTLSVAAIRRWRPHHPAD